MKAIFQLKQPLCRGKSNSFWRYCYLQLSECLRFAAPLSNKGRQIWKSLGSVNLKNFKVFRAPIQTFVHAGQELVARSRVYVQTTKVNGRIITGLGFMFIVAPLSDIMYVLFDKDVKIEGWYYDNMFFLLLCVGPFLNNLFSWLGVYLCLFEIVNKKRLLYCLAGPIGYAVARIVWLIQAKTHEEFHSLPSIAVFVYCILAILFLLFISSYLAWRYHHRARAYEARLDAIVNNADKLTPEQIVNGFIPTWKERQLKAY